MTTCPVCTCDRNESLFLCGGCQLISYCSKDCQKLDWKSHKNSCRPFKITHDPQLGYEWVATRDIPRGTLLLEETPIFYFVNWTGSDIPCLSCGIPFNGRTCSTCHWSICCDKCEQNPMHKENECAVFNSQKIQFPPSQKLKKWFKHAYNSKLDEKSHNLIATCVGYIRALRLAKRNGKSYKLFTAAIQRMGRGKDCPSERYIKMNLSVLKNWIDLKDFNVDWNTLTLISGLTPGHQGEINPVRAVYVKLTQENHSCAPNCVLELAPSFGVKVKTMREVKKGEPLTDNYMGEDRDLARINRRARQLIILMEKGFKCQCQRCLDPTECGSYMDAITCLNCRPNGCLENLTHELTIEDVNLGYFLPRDPVDLNPASEWQCNLCHATKLYETILNLTDSLPDSLAEILRPLTSARVTSFSRLSQCYVEYEKKIEGLLHPNHFGLMMAADGIVGIFKRTTSAVELTESEFKLVMDKAKYLLAIADKVAPGGSRMRKDLLDFLTSFCAQCSRREGLSQEEKLDLILQADFYRREATA